MSKFMDCLNAWTTIGQLVNESRARVDAAQKKASDCQEQYGVVSAEYIAARNTANIVTIVETAAVTRLSELLDEVMKELKK